MFSAIKSGSHILAVAHKKSGKTQASIVASFDIVNKQMEGAPRVLYICSTGEESIRVFEILSKVAAQLAVTVYLTYDKGNQVKQRNDIFDGTEIIVGTIKRVHDLYVQNGINFKLLDYFIIDDLEEVLSQGRVMEIKRLIDGFNKTQLICLVNQRNARVEQFLGSVELDIRVVEYWISIHLSLKHHFSFETFKDIICKLLNYP